MAETDDSTVSAALADVVRDHGWAIADDPARLRATLSDVLGGSVDDHRGTLDAIVVSAEEGIPAQLRVAGGESSSAEQRSTIASQLQDWGMSSERASWVIAAWARITPAPTLPPPPPATTLPPVELLATSMPPATTPEDVAPSTQPEPTTLPTAKPPADLTVLPPAPGSAPKVAPPTRRPRRPGLPVVVGSVVAALLLGGAVAGAVVLTSGDDTHASDAPADSPSDSPSTSSSEAPEPATGTELVAATGVHPTKADKTIAMASRSTGVQIRARSEVDQFGSGEDIRSAPPGGRLIAFSLGTWPCEAKRCGTWADGDLKVQVGHRSRQLPAGDGTYVVAVPKGVDDVDLVMDQDGYLQTLSLLTGSAGPHNIAVLARPRSERTVKIGEKVPPVTETVTASGGGNPSTYYRHVNLPSAQLVFFAPDGARPQNPDSAFLRVTASYSLVDSAGQPLDCGSNGRTVCPFFPTEAQFMVAGSPVPKRQLTTGSDADLMFVVPGRLRSGSFVIGGTQTSSDCRGVPCIDSLERMPVQIHFS